MYCCQFIRTGLTLTVVAQGGSQTVRYLSLAANIFQHWAAVVSCACKLIILFSVAFCLVVGVHNFDFSRVIKQTTNKLQAGERKACSDRDVCFWQELYLLSSSLAQK
jgi:hypothetical protein